MASRLVVLLLAAARPDRTSSGSSRGSRAVAEAQQPDRTGSSGLSASSSGSRRARCAEPASARAMPCGLMAAPANASAGLAPSWPATVAEGQELCTARGCCYTDDHGCFFKGETPAKVSTVHLIMSSHLDVGYTAQPQDVINQAFTEHFPRAAGVGAAIRARGGAERLRWMTHTYLVSLFLDCPPNMGLHCPNATALANFTAAVTAGDITWQAFPHNAELAATGIGMVEAGIDLTRRVERQLKQPAGRTLSIRDVPGVTRGVVPLLAKLGVPCLLRGTNVDGLKMIYDELCCTTWVGSARILVFWSHL